MMNERDVPASSESEVLQFDTDGMTSTDANYSRKNVTVCHYTASEQHRNTLTSFAKFSMSKFLASQILFELAIESAVQVLCIIEGTDTYTPSDHVHGFLQPRDSIIQAGC